MSQRLWNLLPSDSWFCKWGELWPTIESPDTYQLFCAMSAMGAVLGRRCWFDNDIFQIYPMLNLLFIGPSGVGKSTSIMHMAKPLLQSLQPQWQPQIISSGTKEKIHEDLFANPKSILIASELANFFSKEKYKEGLIPYVTQLLDYEDQVEIRTKGGGIITVEKPSVTIMGGSTVEWLQEQLPDSAGTGGFLARFLIVAEEHKGRRVPLPGLHLEPKKRVELDARRTRVFWEFGKLVEKIPQGIIPLQDYEAADIFSYWYSNLQPEVGYLAPFVERSREFVLRMAMLVALSCDRHEIETQDIESAISLYEVATTRLKGVVIPMSGDGRMLAAVLKAIGNQEMTPRELYAGLSSMATDKRIDMLVSSLINSGALVQAKDGKLRRVRK